MKINQVFLASQSPRRKEILEMAGYVVEKITISVEENYPATLSASEVPEFLARKKLSALSSEEHYIYPVIASDTVVVLADKVLGKPKDEQEAYAMVKSLSNSTHVVSSAFAVLYNNHTYSESCHTEVTFNPIPDQAIKFYIKNFKPFDKAGSYGIQEWIGLNYISKIEGSYFSVMGLPMAQLHNYLQSL